MKKLMLHSRSLAYLFVLFFTFNMSSFVIAEELEHEHTHEHQKREEHNDHETHEDNENHKDHKDHEEHEEHREHREHGDESHELTFSAAELDEFSIKLSQAKSGVITKSIGLTGEVVIAPERLFHIAPRVSGIVQKIFKRVGDIVNEGDLLVTLSSHNLADAKAQLVVANSLLQQAQSILKREKELYQNKITAKRDYLAARQAKTEASINRDAAKQRLIIAGLTEQNITKILQGKDQTLSSYHLYAPADGIMIKQQLAVGDSLEANIPSMTVADLSQVWINLMVYQKDLAFIQQGQTVVIGSRFGSIQPDLPLNTIHWISPILDEVTRSATARVIVDNSQGDWRPGLFVNAQVTIEKNDAPIVIPLSSIQTIEGETVVFIQHKIGEFESQRVKLGQKDQQQVEILAGLSLGQTYVSENAFVFKAQSQKSSFGHGHSH